MKIKDFDEAVSSSSLSREIWSSKCITRWRIWCKYYFKEVKEETWAKKTLANFVCCENGQPKEGLTIGLD